MQPVTCCWHIFSSHNIFAGFAWNPSKIKKYSRLFINNFDLNVGCFIVASFDHRHAGFGDTPKFPAAIRRHPTGLTYLLTALNYAQAPSVVPPRCTAGGSCGLE